MLSRFHLHSSIDYADLGNSCFSQFDREKGDVLFSSLTELTLQMLLAPKYL